ncbi:MAG: HEPN domain-containing protein [Armatimonadota bacterium]|nr:HEPN domain-containing protein [Armatimonadota bacterium]
MRREDSGPGSPLAWLRYARADLAYARVPPPEEASFDLACFHVQQAAEKAIKAVLLSLGIDFPYTHSIQTLTDLLPEDVRASAELDPAVELNAYAVLTRYPRDREEVDEQEYREALKIGEAVVLWASTFVIENRG